MRLPTASMRARFGWATAASVIAAAAVALGAASDSGREIPTDAAGATSQGTIYAAVANAKGDPVLGLTARDFAIQVAGTARPVVSAQVASEPLAIVLVVDGLGLARLQQVRLTLRTVVDLVARSEPQARVGIENPPSRAHHAHRCDSRSRPGEGRTGLLARSGRGSPVESATGDRQATLANEPTGRRVILALTAPSAEGGRHAPADLVEAVRRANCQVWNIEVATHADLSPAAGAARSTTWISITS